MTALDVGKRTHVKLETETKNIMKELERVEEDETVARSNSQDHERSDDSEDEDSR